MAQFDHEEAGQFQNILKVIVSHFINGHLIAAFTDQTDTPKVQAWVVDTTLRCVLQEPEDMLDVYLLSNLMQPGSSNAEVGQFMLEHILDHHQDAADSPTALLKFIGLCITYQEKYRPKEKVLKSTMKALRELQTPPLNDFNRVSVKMLYEKYEKHSVVKMCQRVEPKHIAAMVKTSIQLPVPVPPPPVGLEKIRRSLLSRLESIPDSLYPDIPERKLDWAEHFFLGPANDVPHKFDAAMEPEQGSDEK